MTLRHSVYAGDATLVELPLAALLPAGGYCAELFLADPSTGVRDSIECRKRAVTFFHGLSRPERAGQLSGDE